MLTVLIMPLFRQRQPVVLVMPISASHLLKLMSLGMFSLVFIAQTISPSAARCAISRERTTHHHADTAVKQPQR